MKTSKVIKGHTEKLIPLFFSFFNPLNFFVLLRNSTSITLGPRWLDYVARCGNKYNNLAQESLTWIKTSQDIVGSGGVGCYEFYRWTSGYPEVTGYIIPTIWDSYHHFKDKELKHRAIRMADWLLRIQHPCGGWEGFYEGDGQPPIVFNTGQVLRGLIRTYKETEKEKYLNAAIWAGNWIVDAQDADGSWTAANYKQMKRVYDAYVSAPISSLYLITNNEKLAEACRLNCDFVLRNQRPNGWFNMADNSPGGNEAPVLHTISYTIDGLLETGLNLKEEKYVSAGKLAADSLLHKLEINYFYPARFDKNWKASANYSCLTGNAQIGIIFIKLYERFDDKRYLNAALKIADFLAFTQHINGLGRYRKGGMVGSYPIWGLYCPFKYPSWATKYWIDLLLSIKKHVILE